MKRTSLWLSALIGAVLLCACGGGGGGGGDSTPQVTLTASPATLSLDAAGASETLQITTGASWSISGATDWLSLSASSGTGNGSVTVTATANQSGAERSAQLQVSVSGINRMVSISQAAQASSISYDVPPNASGMRDLTSVELTALMGTGINIGNSLEARDAQGLPSETAWGNPEISEALVAAIADAGFKAIRLPVAWSKFSNAETYEIEATWLARVEQVANYALNRGLYVIINEHWDGGWQQPTYAARDEANARLAAMWRQIASHFRDYDDHLLFAGTNEIHIEGEFGAPTAENAEVQNGFNQVFVDAVRATGGRNAYRHLIVQGYNTNIDHTVDFAVLPTDVVNNRLLMEVHFYDPFNFTLNHDSTITQWGANATDSARVEAWANEAWVDAQFLKMKETFYDKGVGLILGEFGATSRLAVADHEPFRVDWNRYVTQSALAHKLVPIYWDMGHTGDNGMGIFHRDTAQPAYPDIIEAVTP